MDESQQNAGTLNIIAQQSTKTTFCADYLFLIFLKSGHNFRILIPVCQSSIHRLFSFFRFLTHREAIQPCRATRMCAYYYMWESFNIFERWTNVILKCRRQGISLSLPQVYLLLFVCVLWKVNMKINTVNVKKQKNCRRRQNRWRFLTLPIYLLFTSHTIMELEQMVQIHFFFDIFAFIRISDLKMLRVLLWKY